LSGLLKEVTLLQGEWLVLFLFRRKMMNLKKLKAIALTTLSLLTLCVLPLKAQDARGTVLGRVTDSSGAVILGA
jgi:hypothetical protein